MKAKSIAVTSPESLQTSLNESTADGFTPTLAIVFISIKQDRDTVVQILRQHDIDVLGATSCGEFIDGHQSEGAIGILLMDMKRSDYTILFEDIGERSLGEAAAQLSKAALQKFKRPAFILCSTSLNVDGTILDGETLIRSIEKTVGPDLTLFGGMAGDDMSFKGTCVFANQCSTGYGVAALIINQEKIDLHGVALSGWKPIGVARTITKSKGNLLYEIDGKPALDMYLRFLGEDFASADEQIRFFDSVGLHYPLQIQRTDREPMMCNPMGYSKEENALILESDVEPGSKFWFSTPPDFDIVDTVIKKATEIRNATKRGAEALLIFSCASRLNALGPMAQQENNGLAEVWSAPMAGFYTYGEFGKAVNGKHEAHSTTCSWVVLSEK
ncbi:MAG: hypothetical protein EOO14_00790 [Chitinophagaceae bacterium]|nr:MAG: hypothetical protein EOO14_00790 [Chitinophagaceae bacterium]